MKNIVFFLCLFFSIAAQEPVEEMPELGSPALPSTEEMPATMSEEKSKQMSQYFDEALKNYEDILSSREDAEIEAGKKREAKNREILQEKQTALNQGEIRLRQIQKEYRQRFLALKNSYEQGRLEKKIYHEQLDKMSKEYSQQIQALKEDITYNRVQIEKTNERLKTLEELNRINTILLEQQGRTPKSAQTTPAEPQRNPTDIELLIPRIQAAGCFNPRPFWISPDIK